METLISILIFIGVMFAMSKLGIGCCGGHSKDEGDNNKKNCCSSEKVIKDDSKNRIENLL